jgi:hypothetical protein
VLHEVPSFNAFYEEKEPTCSLLWELRLDLSFFQPIQMISLSNLESSKNKLTICIGLLLAFDDVARA